MAVELATAYVSLVPSARGIGRHIGRELAAPTQRAAADAGDRAGKTFGSRFSGSIRTVAKAGALGLGVLAVGVGKVLFDAVGAAEESRKVVAQTNEVLRSTGQVAGVSARDVGQLADQLSRKAGVDDELIQSGANVLLTFTKVRNEVGRGNDIFDQGTAIALDMSKALGQDMQSSVIQVGKALNDPIRGITALQRVGVSFTQQQKDQIAALVESGDVLGAQKVILGELTTEFGGSAEAQATATDKLRVIFGNLSESIGKFLLPMVDRVANWLGSVMPRVGDFASAALERVRGAAEAVGSWWADHGPAIMAVVSAVFGGIRDWVRDVAPAIRDWVQNVLGNLGRWWDAHGPTIVSIAADIASGLRELGERAMRAAQFLVDNWHRVAPIFERIGRVLLVIAIPALIRFAAVSTVKAAQSAAAWVVAQAGPIAAGAVYVAQTGIMIARWALLGAQALIHAARVAAAWLISLGPIGLVIAVVAGAVALIIRYWDEISSFITGVVHDVIGFLQRNWPMILAILAGPFGLAVLAIIRHWDTIWGFLRDLPGRIAGFFVAAGQWLLDAGKAIVSGLLDGLKWIWEHTLIGWLITRREAILGFFLGAVDWLWDTGRSILRGLLNGIRNFWELEVRGWMTIKDKILGFFVGAVDWLYETGRSVLRGLLNGIKNVWGNDIIQWLIRLPGRFRDWLSGAVDWLFNAGRRVLSGLLDGIIDKIDDLKNWFLDLPGKILDWLGFSSPPQWAIDAGHLIIEGLIRGLGGNIGKLWDWLKGRGGDIGAFFANLAPTGGSGVERWRAVALGALRYTGQSAHWVDDLLTQMAHESGGNPDAVNLWDINAQRGDPSRGLMQVIGSTFRRYAGELIGRGVTDPFANIVAAIRYTLARYGTLGAWRSRGFRGYQAGAWQVGPGGGYTHPGEMVISARLADALRSLPGGPGGRSGAPVEIGEVHLHDGVDMDLFLSRVEFEITGGRL